MEGTAAEAAEGLDGPDAVVELVGDNDVVVVEAVAEADGTCRVLIVLEGNDDGRVDVEASALQATSSGLSINISVLLHSNYSTRSTQQLVAELEEITRLSVHQYHQEHEYNNHLALMGYNDTE